MHFKLVIHKNAVLTFILVLFLSNLKSIDYIGSDTLSALNDLLRLVAAVSILFLYFLRRKKNVSRFLLLVVIIHGWLLFSTVINEGNVWSCIGRSISCIAIAMLFEDMLGHERDFIRGFMCASEVLCYANLISLIVFSDGMYRNVTEAYAWSTKLNWLLGNKNNFTPYLLVFCIVAFIYGSCGGNVIREWGLYIASFVSVLLASSKTSIVGFAILPVFFLTIRRTKIQFNGYLLFGCNAALYILLVVFRVERLFSFIIEFIFNRRLSISGRLSLWDKVLQLIKEKPMIGYGVRSEGFLSQMTGYSWGIHSHNLGLQIVYEGGIIYLILFLILLFLIYRRLKREQAYRNTQVVIVSLFLFFIMALMEPYNYPFVFFLYAFAYYIRDFNDHELLERKADRGINHLISNEERT